MKKFAVYTVITGKKEPYDNIYNQDINFKEDCVDYFLFTDNKSIKSNFFDVKFIESELSSKILSRDIKINVSKYLSAYEKTLYMDGNVKINNFLTLLLNNMSGEIETYTIDRNIIQEAIWIRNMNYCNSIKLDNKLITYKNQGFNIHNSKTEYGKIILRIRSEKMKLFEDLWFKEYKDILRDQLSLPYCIWKHKLNHQSLGKARLGEHFLKYFVHLGKHK